MRTEIDVLNEDANVAVQRICRETNWRSHRAVLFLDPYGMQVSWATLETVAATKSIDVWMLYPTGMGLPLLKESRLNHVGKLLFQWFYWHALLPGRDIPGVGSTMPMAGKQLVSANSAQED